MLRGTKNGVPLGMNNELADDGMAIFGAYQDVNIACEKWLRAHLPGYGKFPQWWNAPRLKAAPKNTLQ